MKCSSPTPSACPGRPASKWKPSAPARFRTKKFPALIKKHFDFRLAGIIKQFNLRYQPAVVKGGFYRKLAAYGHMGRMDIGLPWELTDKAQLLKE